MLLQGCPGSRQGAPQAAKCPKNGQNRRATVCWGGQGAGNAVAGVWCVGGAALGAGQPKNASPEHVHPTNFGRVSGRQVLGRRVGGGPQMGALSNYIGLQLHGCLGSCLAAFFGGLGTANGGQRLLLAWRKGVDCWYGVWRATRQGWGMCMHGIQIRRGGGLFGVSSCAKRREEASATIARTIDDTPWLLASRHLPGCPPCSPAHTPVAQPRVAAAGLHVRGHSELEGRRQRRRLGCSRVWSSTVGYMHACPALWRIRGRSGRWRWKASKPTRGHGERLDSSLEQACAGR